MKPKTGGYYSITFTWAQEMRLRLRINRDMIQWEHVVICILCEGSFCLVAPITNLKRISFEFQCPGLEFPAKRDLEELGFYQYLGSFESLQPLLPIEKVAFVVYIKGKAKELKTYLHFMGATNASKEFYVKMFKEVRNQVKTNF